MEISGILVDIHRREIYPAKISLRGRIVERVERVEEVYLLEKRYILPGLIDAHIHIESSMTTPGSFAAAAVSRGTTGVVSDPHEIANVLGIDGVMFMIRERARRSR